MRFVVLLLGVLGVAGPAYFGWTWLDELYDEGRLLKIKTQEAELTGRVNEPRYRDALHHYNRKSQATYLLLAAIPLGLVGAFLASLGRGLAGGMLLIVTALGPGALAPDQDHRQNAFIATAPLLVAGILGLFVRRPRPKAPREPVVAEEDEAEPPPRSAKRPPPKKAARPKTRAAARKKAAEEDEDEDED